MKKSNIAKIAALRKCLTCYAYGQDAMIEIIKDYLGDDLDFKVTDTINKRGHAAKHITICDKNDDEREIIAECCAEADEFNFAKIGLAESLRNSTARLAAGIGGSSRIKSKQAWIVAIGGETIGLWKVLVSYQTVIAAWNVNSNIIYVQRNARNYSRATRRHLSDFEAHINRALKITNERAVLKWANWEC
jgi:hypothetical protein